MFLISVKREECPKLHTSGVAVRIFGKPETLKRDGDYLTYEGNRCKILSARDEGSVLALNENSPTLHCRSTMLVGVMSSKDAKMNIDEECQVKSLYPHESQELETVQKFIEEGMRMHARRLAAIEGLVTVEHFIEGVPKGLVMHRICNNLSDTHLRNKILHCPKRGPYGETDDGLTNLKRGAKKVFADCWKVLKKTFVISEDNLITQRVASENADVCLARMARMPTVAEGFAILKQMILNGEVIPLEIVVSCDDGNRVTWNTAGLLREVEVHLAEKRQLAEIGEKSNDIELRRLLHDLCLIDDPTIPDIEYVDGPSPGMCSGIQPEKSPRV